MRSGVSKERTPHVARSLIPHGASFSPHHGFAREPAGRGGGSGATPPAKTYVDVTVRELASVAALLGTCG